MYRPPGNHKSLIRNLFDLFTTEISGAILCGHSLDTCSKIKKSQSKAIYVKKMLKQLVLVGVWRKLQSVDKKCNSYSHSRCVFKIRLHFFMSNFDKHRKVNCDKGVIDISDHAGVYLALNLDVKFDNFVKEEVIEYMHHNNSGKINHCILWDAAKTFLRGKLITGMWSLNKKNIII